MTGSALSLQLPEPETAYVPDHGEAARARIAQHFAVYREQRLRQRAKAWMQNAAEQSAEDAAHGFGYFDRVVLNMIDDGMPVPADIAALSKIKAPQANDNAPAPKPAERSSKIKASPFVLRDPSTIPPREWLFGSHYVRKYATATIGAGGGGKSSNAIPEVLSMVTGRPLLGGLPAKPMRVWYMNLEDPQEEIDRRFHAAALHYRVTAEQLADRLYADSGRAQEVVVVRQEGRDLKVIEPVVSALIAEIRALQIDVIIVDPFISSHRVPENDNTAVQTVAEQWVRVAEEANCCVELVHHVRKQLEGHQITADDVRGGGALKDKVRSLRVINGMTKEQASEAGVPVDDRDLYFRVDAGKANMARKGGSTQWRKFESVSLGNGKGLFKAGDNIGVVTAWEWPSRNALVEEVDPEKLIEIKRRMLIEPCRENDQARDWAGHVVAQVLDMPSDTKESRKPIKRMIAAWIEAGHFEVQMQEDSKRQQRPYLVPVMSVE